MTLSNKIDNLINKYKGTESLHSDICPTCGKKLIYINGKFGYFLGCTGYPNCNYKRKSYKIFKEPNEHVS